MKHCDATTHLSEWPQPTRLTPHAAEGVEPPGLCHCWPKRKMVRATGRQLSSFIQNQTHSYHIIQQSCSLVFTQRNWKHEQKPAHRCLQQLLPYLEATKMSFSGCVGKLFPLPSCSGEGNGNPLQYSCLENPMDGGDRCRLLSMGLQRVGHDWATSLSFIFLGGG